MLPVGSIAQHIDFEQGGIPEGWTEVCPSELSPWSVSVSPSNRALRAATNELLQPDGADSWLFSPALPSGGSLSLRLGTSGTDTSALRFFLVDSPSPNGRIIKELKYHPSQWEKVQMQPRQLTLSLKDETLEVIGHETADTRIKYVFKRCMQNKLYTFYKVYVEGTDGEWIVVNEATSDNIGPVDVLGAGSWSGGDHLYADQGKVKTARCESVAIYADGKEITEAKNITASEVEIRVVNTLFDPRTPPEEGDTMLTVPFIEERVYYRLNGSGNSLYVKVHHSYLNDEPVIVNSYYGMQSMFVQESNIMSQAGRVKANGDYSITKDEQPDFHRFVELRSSNKTYQSAWLLPHGLGSHSRIWGGSPILLHPKGIYKTYHVLIKWREGVKAPAEFGWEGVYSWGRNALIDNAAAHVTQSKIGATNYLFAEMPLQHTLEIPAKLTQGAVSLLLPADGAKIKSLSEDGTLTLSCTRPCSAVVVEHEPIDLTSEISSPIPDGPVYLAIHYQGKSQAFAIDDIHISAESGIDEVQAERPEQFFDLQGRRVQNPSHGIYISNRKKLVKCSQ